MKNKILILAGLLLTATGSFLSARADVNKGQPTEGVITVASSPDLNNLLQRWTTEYGKQNPGSTITIGSPVTQPVITGGNQVNFITSDFYTRNNVSGWKMLVGRDAVVPVISGSNPLLNLINDKGIYPGKLAEAIQDPAHKNWSTLLNTKDANPLTLYLPYNTHVADIVSHFLSLPRGTLNYTSVENEEAVIAAVQKDPNGIGFTRMFSLCDPASKNLPANILLLPIDKNGNGKLDYHEKIYNNWDNFLRGVWIGKYPHGLCQDIYACAPGQPQSKAEIDFLKWVLTSGQSCLKDYGYFDLAYGDRQHELDQLTVAENVPSGGSSYSTLKIVLLSLVGLVVIGLVVTYLLNYLRDRRKSASEIHRVAAGVLDENAISVLQGLYFDRSHTWSFMEKDGRVKVGIDDFLQHVTGPITCVKMKKSGETVNKGEAFLSVIQEGKRLNIKSPVTGTIMEHNDMLIMNSNLVNTSPFNDGWIYKIEPSNWLKDIQSFFMGDRYRTWIHQEMVRLKDFLSSSLKEHRLELSAVALQDGGPLQDNVLAGFGPEIWDDFQTKYLDTIIY